MSRFEEHLWAELVREQAILPPPNAAKPVGRQRKLPRISIAAAMLAGGCAIVLVLVLPRGGGGSAGAFTLTQGSDALGPTINLTIKEVIAAGPANEALAKLGVRVRVAKVEAGCAATGTLVSPSELPSGRNEMAAIAAGFWSTTSPSDMTWTIHPQLVPSGDTLVIRAEEPHAERPAKPPFSSLYQGAAPECVSPVPVSEAAAHR